ncbi:MAG: hypothetical protein C0504_15470 [Candidatus Solibacter sp.]|nr:hypothetical protein [Candidatus Solibacter sp.]
MKLIRYAIALTVFAAVSPGADQALLGLVPAGAHMVSGLDVDRARDSAFGRKILNEMKQEDAGFQKLVEQTGFDPRRDLRSVVMASAGKPGPGNALVAVRGAFDISKITRLAETQGAQSSIYKGIQVWTPKQAAKPSEGSFAMLDPTLAVFGGDAMVKAAIDAKLSGAPKLPAGLVAKIAEWSGMDAWFVSTASLSEMGVGKPGQNEILPGGLAIEAIREAAAGVRFAENMEISGDILTRSAQDAAALADVMRMLANMIRLNAGKPGADAVVPVADSLQVSVADASTKFTLTVPAATLDQMFSTRGKRVAKRGDAAPAAAR